MCQILLQSLKLWRRYGDFSIFKMATAAFLDFRNFKFLTVGAVKRVRLCHLAKFRRNRSNRGRDMAIFRCFKMTAAMAKRWRPCTAKITTMEMLAGFCTHALDRSALNSARCALTRQILSDCMCFPSSLRSEKLPILPFFQLFQLCHSVVATPSVVETNLNAGARLYTFPCPIVPRSFPNSKAFMAKWRSKTLLVKSVTDKEKD